MKNDFEQTGDIDVDGLFKMTVLDTMRWAQEARESVSNATVTTCWRHTSILAEDIYELVSGVERLRLCPPPMHSLAE